MKYKIYPPPFDVKYTNNIIISIRRGITFSSVGSNICYVNHNLIDTSVSLRLSDFNDPDFELNWDDLFRNLLTQRIWDVINFKLNTNHFLS